MNVSDVFVIRYIFVFLAVYLPFSTVVAADFTQAQQLISEGSYTQALEVLDGMEISASNESDQARKDFIQAQALTLSGASNQAIDVYTKLAQNFPESPEPYLNLSALYADQGDLELAREWAIKGLRSKDNYKKLYDNLATIHGVLAANAYRVALNDPSSVNAPALAVSSDIRVEDYLTVEVASEEIDEDDPSVDVDIKTVAATATPKHIEIGPEVEAEVVVKEEVEVESPSQPELEDEPGTVTQVAPVTPVEVLPQIEVETPIEAEALVDKAEPVEREDKAKEEALSESPEYLEIQAFVLSWAEEWSRQDVEGYISKYVETYAPEGFSHDEWAQQRRVRLTNKSFIKVSVEQVNITNQGDDLQVEFWQTYESDAIEDTIKKRLSLKRVENRWLISAEQVL